MSRYARSGYALEKKYSSDQERDELGRFSSGGGGGGGVDSVAGVSPAVRSVALGVPMMVRPVTLGQIKKLYEAGQVVSITNDADGKQTVYLKDGTVGRLNGSVAVSRFAGENSISMDRPADEARYIR